MTSSIVPKMIRNIDSYVTELNLSTKTTADNLKIIAFVKNILDGLEKSKSDELDKPITKVAIKSLKEVLEIAITEGEDGKGAIKSESIVSIGLVWKWVKTVIEKKPISEQEDEKLQAEKNLDPKSVTFEKAHPIAYCAVILWNQIQIILKSSEVEVKNQAIVHAIDNYSKLALLILMEHDKSPYAYQIFRKISKKFGNKADILQNCQYLRDRVCHLALVDYLHLDETSKADITPEKSLALLQQANQTGQTPHYLLCIKEARVIIYFIDKTGQFKIQHFNGVDTKGTLSVTDHEVAALVKKKVDYDSFDDYLTKNLEGYTRLKPKIQSKKEEEQKLAKSEKAARRHHFEQQHPIAYNVVRCRGFLKDASEDTKTEERLENTKKARIFYNRVAESVSKLDAKKFPHIHNLFNPIKDIRWTTPVSELYELMKKELFQLGFIDYLGLDESCFHKDLQGETIKPLLLQANKDGDPTPRYLLMPQDTGHILIYYIENGHLKCDTFRAMGTCGELTVQDVTTKKETGYTSFDDYREKVLKGHVLLKNSSS